MITKQEQSEKLKFEKAYQKYLAQVEKTNEKYLKATVEQKRVMVAKDVLLLIKAGMQPLRGCVLDTEFGKGSIKDILSEATSATYCRVCAKGAMLIGHVGRVNEMRVSQVRRGSQLADPTHIKLLEIFTPELLDEMEILFEGKSYLYILSDKYKSELLDVRASFKNTFGDYDSSKILTYICNQLIKSKGKKIYLDH